MDAAKLRDRIAACERLIADDRAPQGERDAAKAAISRLYERLGEAEPVRPREKRPGFEWEPNFLDGIFTTAQAEEMGRRIAESMARTFQFIPPPPLRPNWVTEAMRPTRQSMTQITFDEFLKWKVANAGNAGLDDE